MRCMSEYLAERIVSEIHKSKAGKLMFRVDGFEDASIYYEICSKIQNDLSNQPIHLTAKLSRKKYELLYQNTSARDTLDQMCNHEWVDLEDHMTFYRNKPQQSGKRSIILLMGTDMVDDQGGLHDFFCVNPTVLDSWIGEQYSELIPLNGRSQFCLENESFCKAFNNFYHTLFSSIRRNLKKLSSQIDVWLDQRATTDEIITDMFYALPDWDVPVIIDGIPSITQMASGKKLPILEKACEFILRKKFLQAKKSQYVKIGKQFDQYELKEKHYAMGFPANQSIESYGQLKSCVQQYAGGLNLTENRDKLLRFDYTVVEDIIKTKLDTDAPNKPDVLVGTPQQVLLEAFFLSAAAVDKGVDFDRVVFHFTECKIGVKGCCSVDKMQTAVQYFIKICQFAGGVEHFIDQESWERNDELLSFSLQPVDFFEVAKAENQVIKPTSTEHHKISFVVELYSGDELMVDSYDFVWDIDPDSDWMVAFSGLQHMTQRLTGCVIPFAVWPRINSAFRAKSKEEFLLAVKQTEAIISYQNLIERLERSFEASPEMASSFNRLGNAFGSFVDKLSKHGFYSTIEGEAPRLITCYTDAAEKLYKGELTGSMRSGLKLFINAFLISENDNGIRENTEMKCAIVPPYHPAMLEKLVDRAVFIRTGMKQWFERTADNKTKEPMGQALARLLAMSHIHTGLDALYGKNMQLMPASCSYGYYALYGHAQRTEGFIRAVDMLQKEAVFDEDFKVSDFKKQSAEAQMILRVLKRYRFTYGQAHEHIALTFVNPNSLQSVVAALSAYVAEERKNSENEMEQNIPISMDVTILQPETGKGGRNYLAYWLDMMLNADDQIALNVYLESWTVEKDIPDMIPANTDIVFFMDIMRSDSQGTLKFWKIDPQEAELNSECRYPMVFRASADPSTSFARKVDVTQMQFLASTAHTQVLHRTEIASEPDPQLYKLQQSAKLGDQMESVISKAHDRTIWVVCIDEAMDRKSIRDIRHDLSCPIIGYTTGEGSFGQLNLTITTRKSVSSDIIRRCKFRLKMIFTKWDDASLERAGRLCLDKASQLDGASVLLALNPSAYEINNYLAYLMMDVICSRSSGMHMLIRLDSYRHWFSDIIKDENQVGVIPDFLLLQMSLRDGHLHLDAHVIECKIAKYVNAEVHMEKALTQVASGLEILAERFRPQSESAEHRYWLAQLYRSIAFTQDTNTTHTDEEKQIAALIPGIIDGKFSIDWSGDIYGFWFDWLKDGIHDSYTVLGDGQSAMRHDVGQGEILRILLNKDQDESVKFEEEIGHLTIDEEETDKEDEPADVENNISNDEDDEPGSADPDTNGQGDAVIIPPKPSEDDPDAAGKTDSHDETETPDKNEVSETGTIPLDQIRVFLGKDKANQSVYWEFGHKGLTNRHLMITGSSGQGKSYAIQTMLYELAKQGISSVIFDYTDGFLPNKLEKPFDTALHDRITQHVAVLNKLPVNPFKRQKIRIEGFSEADEPSSQAATRFADIMMHVFGFGEQQFAAIYDACKTGIDRYGDTMDFKKLQRLLEGSTISQAKTVLSKMKPFFDLDLFDTQNDFDWHCVSKDGGQVTIIQLTQLDRQTQTVVTEIMLWDAWYSLTVIGNKNTPFVVVLDEAQNLSFKEGSPAQKILQEGRKFGWSAWFATQFLKGALASDEISRLQQAAEQLTFKPTTEEMSYTAAQISGDKQLTDYYLSILKSMQKGQCIVRGDRIKPNGEFGAAKPTLIRIESFEGRMRDHD